LDDPAADVGKKLDEIVGTKFETAGETRSRIVKCVIGALFAVTAVSLIVLVIESHRLPKDVPRRAAKPVEIQIVPDAARRQ
jgi:hypothetical protein